MNIKGLLFGSAAALVMGSAANAADAIVAAEPEPLDYVRICDAFGSGYFFIPGTDTCLKIGGMVRTEGEWHNAYDPADKSGTFWHNRDELDFDTATDTEYGPLKTNVVIRYETADEGPTTAKVLFANISLGGFMVGKFDSQFNYYAGYAGDVVNDDVIYDGAYELNQLTYTYGSATGTGLSAVVSLEDNYSTDSGASYGSSFWSDEKADHYAPDVVAGLGYSTGTLGFKLVGGYDSIVEEGAIKARVDAKFGGVEAFLMGGWNTDGDKLNKYAGTNQDASACTINGVRNDAKCGWGDWALWAGVGVPVSEKLKWNLQLAYTDSKIFEATTNVKFKPVKNLTIEPELTYVHYDYIGDDTVAGVLRFQRDF